MIGGNLIVKTIVCSITVLGTLGVMMGMPQPAEAHLKDGYTAYFHGRTFKNYKAALKGNYGQSDPITLIFRFGSAHRATGTILADHFRKAEDGHQKLWEKMQARECEGAAAGHKDDPHVRWDGIGDRYPAQSKRFGATKWNHSWTTSVQCGRQWHLRMWNDTFHKNNTVHHGDTGSWLIGSMHHEHRNWNTLGLGFHHEVDVSWDVAETQMILKVRSHLCAYKDWKYIPFSQGEFGGKDITSNGMATLILMTHPRSNPDRPPCPSSDL